MKPRDSRPGPKLIGEQVFNGKIPIVKTRWYEIKFRRLNVDKDETVGNVETLRILVAWGVATYKLAKVLFKLWAKKDK